MRHFIPPQSITCRQNEPSHTDTSFEETEKLLEGGAIGWGFKELISALVLVKTGQCPLFPSKDRMQCSTSCKSDNDCNEEEKCCESMCGFVCADAWIGKDWVCLPKHTS